MEWQVVAITLGGLVGQGFKSLKNVPTWLPQCAMLLAGTVAYVAYHPPGPGDALAFLRYLLEAVISGAAVNGVASVVGLHPSLKTDSR